MRLIGNDKQTWENRGHFFAAAAEAMRRILVENARRKQRARHGGGLQRIELDESELGGPAERRDDDLIDLDEALARFARQSELKANLVKLRYFAGLTIPQAAQALGISHATAERHWTYARCWLRTEIQRIQDGRSA